MPNSTFATKDALNDLEDAVNNKVDESAVETALEAARQTKRTRLLDMALKMPTQET